MKLLILFCLVGAALALFDDKWKMMQQSGVGFVCKDHVDCTPLCKKVGYPLQSMEGLCQGEGCFCKVQPAPK